jgi:hypothetical protein
MYMTYSSYEECPDKAKSATWSFFKLLFFLRQACFTAHLTFKKKADNRINFMTQIAVS